MENGFIEATLLDIPTIRDIAEETFFKTYKDIVPPVQLDWMYDWMYSVESLTAQITGGHKFFIYFEKGVALGFISVERTAEDVFCFQKIYLRPCSHGLGLGRKPLDKGFEYVASFNVQSPRVELHVNRKNTAVEFYKHIGFEIASSGDFEIHPGYYMNDYVMAIHP